MSDVASQQNESRQEQSQHKQAKAGWVQSLNWEAVSGEAFKRLSAEEQLVRIRHSAAHVMASAIEAIWPTVQFATGPATPQGFFYDVKPPEPIREEHLEAIQQAFDKIAGRSEPFETTEISKAEAIELFESWNQPHKIEVLERIPSERVTLYRHGQFIDLCAGPHVPHTGLCRNTKILTLAATHWRGEDIPSLTRIAGTAWSKPKDLERYLEFLAASKARDHRVLGPQLDLFSFHPWAASALWHPKGVILRNLLTSFWRETIGQREYVEIMNPLLYRKELFETSGHWDHFQENMFIFKDDNNEPSFALKPMNCPDTMLYFRSQTRSYRDLPLRIAEGQVLHRNEATGALHGIMRTRNFIQDDAHIFLAPEHIQDEVNSLLQMLDEIYSLFELEYNFRFSTRPDNFMGDPSVWDEAEAGLRAALEATGRPYQVDEGEGAFYGPKIDVYILDSLGREWQCGTVQLDFQLPERFELKYVAQDGSYQRPIVVHRAIFGSFERFMGILIEHLGGAFPTWLSPVQAVILPIAERHHDYAHQLRQQLKAIGIRVEINGEDSINYRIRSAETQKIPYMLVVGDREAADQTVSVRRYHGGGKQQVLPVTELIDTLQQAATQRTFDVTVQRFDDLFRKPSANLSTEAADY
ncbi:MAG: threonine--tRNA ligase [Candidatus Melainabacteria bacterium]|nr:threonine--tRNA ligase [Candidatus Melainabacteria bacterium]